MRLACLLMCFQWINKLRTKILVQANSSRHFSPTKEENLCTTSRSQNACYREKRQSGKKLVILYVCVAMFVSIIVRYLSYLFVGVSLRQEPPCPGDISISTVKEMLRKEVASQLKNDDYFKNVCTFYSCNIGMSNLPNTQSLGRHQVDCPCYKS